MVVVAVFCYKDHLKYCTIIISLKFYISNTQYRCVQGSKIGAIVYIENNLCRCSQLNLLKT